MIRFRGDLICSCQRLFLRLNSTQAQEQLTSLGAHKNENEIFKAESSKKEVSEKIKIKKETKSCVESPELNVEFAKKIESITSIDVSKEVITWINIDKHGTVKDWNYHQFPEELRFKHIPEFDEVYNHLNLVFEEKIPKDTNAFLFEIKRYKARDLKFLPTVLKIQRSEVIMQSIVKNSILNNLKNSSSNEDAPTSSINQQIFLLNASRVGRMFDLVVGNERVKSANLVALLLKQSINPSEEILNIRSRIRRLILKVTPEHQELFLKSKHKEPLSINYLQASSFAHIINNIIDNSNS